MQPRWKELKDIRVLRPTLPSTPESDQHYASKNKNNPENKGTNLSLYKLEGIKTSDKSHHRWKPMWEQRQDVWLEPQCAEPHPWVPTLGRGDSPQRARYLRQVKRECTKFSYTFSDSRITPSAHMVPNWKAWTPSVLLTLLLVLWHLTPTGSHWLSPPTSPLHPSISKKVPSKAIFCTLERIRGNTIKTSWRIRIVILRSHAW